MLSEDIYSRIIQINFLQTHKVWNLLEKHDLKTTEKDG